MTENKVFIAEQETLLEVKEQTEKLIRNLIPTDAPIYGMVIHEASDLNTWALTRTLSLCP